MTGDIASVVPANPSIAQLRASITANQVMTLFNAAANLIPQGQTAEAEVVTLKQADQQFQLLLRVLLANGNQTSLMVNSNLPFTPGTRLMVAQASPNELTLSLQQINNALNNVKTELDTRQIPVGTLLQGKVLTSQVVNQAIGQLAATAQPQTPAASSNAAPATTPLPGPAAGGPAAGSAASLPASAQYRSIVLLLNTALAGTSLSIESPQPLTVGSLLSARVQGSQALSFVPLPGRLDQLAIAQQLSVQQSRQGSLQALLGTLQNLTTNPTLANPASLGQIPLSQAPVGLASISPAVQASIDQLFADLPDIEQMTSPRHVAQALNASGLFMESRLLAGQNLSQLPDMKANLMRLVASLLPPGVPANAAYDAAAASNTLVRALPSAIRNALGTLDQVAARNVPVNFPLPSRNVAVGAEEKEDLQMLLKLAAAAISRLQSHQLGALEQTRTTAEGQQVTTWQTEVPMRHAHDIVPLQVKVQREERERGEGSSAGEDGEPQTPREMLWHIDLAFDLEPLGPLQVHARLVRGTLSSQLWAERESSAQLIEREMGHLRERLVACGLSVGELSCSQGSAPKGRRTQLEQRWIDENA